MNLLTELKKFSVIVADTSDIKDIQCYKPQDATTNPSIILNSITLKNFSSSIEDALNYARQKKCSREEKIIFASNKLTVNIGTEILKFIPGRISTEINAYFSFNRLSCIKQARDLIHLYELNNINKNRVLIKLAATWDGIQAAYTLEKEGIHCNMTLIFSFAQAAACADAGVTLISPFIGRIYDWFYPPQKNTHYNAKHDPGIQAIYKIYYHYKKYNYLTQIMGSSFRNIQQIMEVSGCDYLTISSKLLNELHNTKNQFLSRKLFFYEKTLPKPTPLSEFKFYQQHNKNIMAIEKLEEGIRQFSHDQKKIENILDQKL